jgi:colicin import membrane protein
LSTIEARESRIAAGAALLIHGLLGASLLVSLNWTRDSKTPVQAELWSSLPPPIPSATRPPPPTPAPTPVTPAPAPAVSPADDAKAEIALQKKKDDARKAEELKKERDRKAAERKEAERKEQERKRAERKENERKEQERKEAARQEAERKAAEKRAAEKKLAEQRAAEKLAAQRQAELARLGLDPNAKADAQGKDVISKAGVVGGAELGSKTGVDAGYEALIQARIKARINYPDRSPGNPEAVVIVEQLPSGEISNVRLVRPSGTPAWDNAVQRAIWAANPLPKKKDGTVARVLELRFRPKENP